MSAIVIYEILHCLVPACLAAWLFCRALEGPARPTLYVLAAAAAVVLAVCLRRRKKRAAPPAASAPAEPPAQE